MINQNNLKFKDYIFIIFFLVLILFAPQQIIINLKYGYWVDLIVSALFFVFGLAGLYKYCKKYKLKNNVDRLKTSKEQAKNIQNDIISDFGALMERQEKEPMWKRYVPESELPHPKDDILKAIALAMNSEKDGEFKNSLVSAQQFLKKQVLPDKLAEKENEELKNLFSKNY